MTATDEDAFEAIRHFADVWHDKYAQRHVPGVENRKAPSLTMRANGVAAVLTEPQLQAVVAEYARMRSRVAELEAHPWLDVDPGGVLADGVREIQDRRAAARVAELESENARMRQEWERELCHAYGSGWCDAAETVFVGRGGGTSGQEAGWQEYRREMGARIESNATSQQFARDEGPPNA